MKFSKEQIKGRIKRIAAESNADPRFLMRLYMMEEFLNRLSKSRYKDNFIIKGGLLVTSMIGVSMRSTMDIDASINGFDLNPQQAEDIIREICNIDDNEVTFDIYDVSVIMDDCDYYGIRVSLNGIIDSLIVPFKIDISTGDVITPGAVEYQFHPILQSETIELWSYNIETLLAEKIQTVLSRNVFNTRMRDFYDIYILTKVYGNRIDYRILKDALVNTCRNRTGENILADAESIIDNIQISETLDKLWTSYKKKYCFAGDIEYDGAINSIREIVNKSLNN